MGVEPVAYGTVSAILILRLCNRLSDLSHPPHYWVWFCITVLSALGLFRGKRSLAISNSLGWSSQA